MKIDLAQLVAKMKALEADMERELERELKAKRELFRYRFEEQRIRFERQVHEWHEKSRIGTFSFLRAAGPIKLLVSPVIYSMIVPLLLFDLWLWLYQTVCFPAYGIEKVSRSSYMDFDRSELDYLNWIQKVNCGYCSYANGLIAYSREVASRTEQYFCPIKHARKLMAAHARYFRFLDFGDAEGFRKNLGQLREELRPRDEKPG